MHGKNARGGGKIPQPFRELKDQIVESGAPRVSEEADVKAVAKAETSTKADIDQHRAAGVERRRIDPLGHEQDFRRRNVESGGGEHRLDFGKVGFRGDDEFELKGIAREPLAEDVGPKTGFFVALDPSRRDRAAGWRGV